jgi:hypothetical protein
MGIMEEVQVLDASDLNLRPPLHKELTQVYEADELYWYSRPISNWLLKGDNNIEFFIEWIMVKKIKKY